MIFLGSAVVLKSFLLNETISFIIIVVKCGVIKKKKHN